MSGENRHSTTPQPAPSLFTINPVGFHENVNYGFQNFHPEDPPPKYEDVISGYPRYDYPPIPTAEPAYQSVDLNASSTRVRISTAHSEFSSEENGEASKCRTWFNDHRRTKYQAWSRWGFISVFYIPVQKQWITGAVSFCFLFVLFVLS